MVYMNKFLLISIICAIKVGWPWDGMLVVRMLILFELLIFFFLFFFFSFLFINSYYGRCYFVLFLWHLSFYHCGGCSRRSSVHEIRFCSYRHILENAIHVLCLKLVVPIDSYIIQNKVEQRSPMIKRCCVGSLFFNYYF